MAITHNYSMFCSLNCHGVNNSVEYIRSFLSNNHCDFLCLQELWLIDSDLHKLNNIHTDYTYVATSGMDSSSHFLSGRPFGGVGILFKKSLSPHIENIVCNSKRVCGILITMHNNFTCMLLSIYMPGNNYSMSSVRPEFSDTLDCIESLFNTIDCNAQICCEDYNVSFDRRDAHLEYLKNFISRNNVYSSWDHSASNKDYTYTNFSLGHKSCIDNFFTSKIYLKKLKIIMLYLMLIINLIIMLLFYYCMLYLLIYLFPPLYTIPQLIAIGVKQHRLIFNHTRFV